MWPWSGRAWLSRRSCPSEATARLAMLLRRRSVIGRRSADCSSGRRRGGRRHRWREPLAHQVQPHGGPQVAEARGIAMTAPMTDPTSELNPPPRLLLGPGPINADPRVAGHVHAAAGPVRPGLHRLHGRNHGAPEAAVSDHQSLGVPGQRHRAGRDRGDFGLADRAGRQGAGPRVRSLWPSPREIAERAGGEVRSIETEWGTVFAPETIEEAVSETRPKVVALAHGDTSTTMAQPLEAIGAICRRARCSTWTQRRRSAAWTSGWTPGRSTPSPPASRNACRAAGIGACHVQRACRRGGPAAQTRRERGRARGLRPRRRPRIRSNYFDLAMLMDYWSELRLNHHTESTSMLYAARECARIVLAEGLPACFERHALTSAALTAGLRAMGLELFGDQAHKMANVTGVVIPAGVDGEAVRASLLNDFGIEIGTPSACSRPHLAHRHHGLQLPQAEYSGMPRALEVRPAPAGICRSSGGRGGPGSGGIPRGGAPGLGRVRRAASGAAAQPLGSSSGSPLMAGRWQRGDNDPHRVAGVARHCRTPRSAASDG